MNEIIIKGICSDSRKIQSGDLFFALPGMTVDGRDFIESAIQKGAVAVICESDAKHIPPASQGAHKVPIIAFQDLKNAMGSIASRYYDHPSQKMKLIGITGTNGKTSIAHFIAEIFAAHQVSCGVMGTLGAGFLPNLTYTEYTTADAILTQKLLSQLYLEKAKYVAMEVTSHALMQGRVKGCEFDTTIFSNLTRDHLDYHGNMENYWQSKKLLFTEYKPQHVLVNLETAQGQELMQALPNAIGYSREMTHFSKNQVIFAKECRLDAGGLYARLETPWGAGDLYSPLFGLFNLSNILAALGAVCLQGLPINTVLKAISQLKPVPGRMNALGGGNRPKVIVDFAHTPDALAQVLQAVRQHCIGKIYCVFGCGGDRDPGKRSMMGEVAVALCDQVIVTQDNSRTENPNNIIADIMKNIQDKQTVQIMLDRAQAIRTAILGADSQDFVIIAGKGAETHQILGQEKIPFSDTEVALSALNELNENV